MYTTRAGVDGLLRNPDTYIGNKVAALTHAATVTLDPSQGNVFTITPAENETINFVSSTNSGVISGQELILVVYTSGVTSFTLTFGTNVRSTGTLATGTVSGKVFMLCFACDGTNYIELSRTVAIA